MKLTAEQKCKMQEWLANLKCPRCFSTRCTCQPEDTTAKCQDCGCEMKFDPDMVPRID